MGSGGAHHHKFMVRPQPGFEQLSGTPLHQWVVLNPILHANYPYQVFYITPTARLLTPAPAIALMAIEQSTVWIYHNFFNQSPVIG